MIHVLEHVHDPVRVLQRCHSLLRPKGILLICVPNDIQSWSSKIRATVGRLLENPRRSSVLGLRRVTEAPEIHLSHFTEGTLRLALERCGFALRRIDCDPFYAASGLSLALHEANYQVHRLLSLSTYQALWAVAEKSNGARG
jgi:SAM-dependent methyltransferase